MSAGKGEPGVPGSDRGWTKSIPVTDVPMDVEIVICTFNRSALLRRTLQYLDRARRPNDCAVGVLVVLNACTDDSDQMLVAHAGEKHPEQRLPLRWIEEPRRGKSFALNTAIEACSAPIMAFVDDDHRVDDGYIVGIHRAVQDYPDSDIYCGRILPDWDGREPAWLHADNEYAVYPLPVPRYDLGDQPRGLDKEGPIPGGGNLFLRSSDFMRRALAAGAVLRYVPTVVQYHYVDGERLRLGYLVRKSYQRSLAVTRVQHAEARLPPRYLWRKLGGYLLHLATSLSWPQTRFYLVRVAAALGELSAYFKRRPVN
ncbi:MAG: glycosyltransferase family 2 protein [Gammaproteobacteria bacterium]